MEQNNKKIVHVFLAVALTILLVSTMAVGAIVTKNIEKNDEDTLGTLSLHSETFYGSIGDNTLYREGVDYNDVWKDSVGDSDADGDPETLCIGQWIPFPYVTKICRSYIFFDTEELPDDAVIISAELYLYGVEDQSYDDFSIIVQRGDPPWMFPNNPPNSGDYCKGLYKGNGGEFATSVFNTEGYNNITLSKSWVDKTYWTKLCLRSSTDIAGSPPYDQEWVKVYSAEKGGNYMPKLIVRYYRPPTATINSVFPDRGVTPGIAVTFEGGGADVDGLIEGYVWESDIDGTLSTKKTFSISSLSVGKHQISLKVHDDDNMWSEPTTVELKVQPINYAPTLRFSINGDKKNVKTEKQLKFNAQGSDGNGGYLKFYVDWDDGTQDTRDFNKTHPLDWQPSHTYTKMGWYTVSCYAEDLGGLKSNLCTIDLRVSPKSHFFDNIKSDLLERFPILSQLLHRLQNSNKTKLILPPF